MISALVFTVSALAGLGVILKEELKDKRNGDH